MEEEITKNPQYIQLPTKLPPAVIEYFVEDIGDKKQVKLENDIKGNFAHGCHYVIMNDYNYSYASQKFQYSLHGVSGQPNDNKYKLESKYILAVWYLFGIGGNITGVSQNVKQSIEYLIELVTGEHKNSITFLNYILDFISKNIEVTEETKQQIENIINNINNISSLQDTKKDNLKQDIINLLNTNCNNGKGTIIQQLQSNFKFKEYIERKQTEIVQNCRQTVSQIKYKENYALDGGLKYIKTKEKGGQSYSNLYPIFKSSANFYQNPISSYIVGLWSLFGKDGSGDYTVEPNSFDAVKYLGQAIVGCNEKKDGNTFIPDSDIELTTIKFLYGLSLILASEFSNFEDLKTLLQQQGIDKIKGIDITNINNKNDIIQLGINIVNDSKLLNTQENEVIHNIITKLQNIKYDGKTYSIFKCTKERGGCKDHYNINDIFRIAECVLQEHETQNKIQQQTGQQKEQERNDNLSVKLNRLLTDYEKEHRKVTVKNLILPTDKLKNTLQILQQIKIQIDEQDKRIQEIKKLEEERNKLIESKNKSIGGYKGRNKSQEYIQKQPQIKKIEDEIKQKTEEIKRKIETIENIDLKEYSLKIIKIEENRKESREELEKYYGYYHNGIRRNCKETKQNPKTTPTLKAIRKPIEIQKEEKKETEEDIQEKSTENSGNGMMIRGSCLPNIRITQEQKEEVIQTALTRQPIKRRLDHKEDYRVIDSMIPGKKRVECLENELSNTAEKEGKAIDLTLTEDARQESRELNQQNEQLHGATSAFTPVNITLYTIIPPK